MLIAGSDEVDIPSPSAVAEWEDPANCGGTMERPYAAPLSTNQVASNPEIVAIGAWPVSYLVKKVYNVYNEQVQVYECQGLYTISS
ncbi:hypothetical protein [Paenibacillus popilliae]|uniref:Reverse gyrase n=1 Tax=Paenibacillus popilliae ATCC 14706 TaxID=1212764 RepID=M9LP45_PAEPP|nr:hypothetical protein [Paenibacillus popilliae]GAC42201.1 reverse gyrase [Paenibacillus popilliae ATCC 14706]